MSNAAAMTLALLTVAEEQQPEHGGSREGAFYRVLDLAQGLQSWPAEAKARLYSLAVDQPGFVGSLGEFELAVSTAFDKTVKEFRA